VTAVALRVVDRLAAREASWRELDALLDALANRRRRRITAAQVLRLGELYRAACTDLMLAESHHLPREAVGYLHALVGRAHNTLYRARGFKFSDWAADLFGTVPCQLRGDPALRLAAVVFWGAFLLCGLLAAGRPDFAPRVAGEAMLDQMDEMYATPLGTAREAAGERNDTLRTGFYIRHNASIGLQCFAWGLFFGLGSLFELLSNGIILGTVFGAMARGPHAANFFSFVTAHAPFELTAIVFSGAAGLRLGSGLIDTQGQTRLASLQREAARALPVVAAAVILFVLAAFLEGFVSPSPLPYTVKAAIALVTAALLAAYLGLGGRFGEKTRNPKSDTAAGCGLSEAIRPVGEGS
jgi:uncharacterized membrane protein SpoIIM required for sporulation